MTTLGFLLHGSFHAPWIVAYWPIQRHAREGERSGRFVISLSKIVPRRYIESKLGVIANGLCPAVPMKSHRNGCEGIIRIFGFFGSPLFPVPLCSARAPPQKTPPRPFQSGIPAVVLVASDAFRSAVSI